MGEIVTGVTQKGEGVIRIKGKVCFVPGALPGEEITVEHLVEKKKFSRARLQKILQPAPFRVEPVCPNTQHCGGCVWQHVTYEKGLELKRNIIAQQLQRLAGIEVPVRPVIGMENPWHYRNKVTWHCAREKTTGLLRLGFFQEESHAVVSLKGCLLPPEKMLQIGCELEEKAAFYGLKEGDEVVIRQSSLDESLLLAVYGRPSSEALRGLVEKFPDLRSVCVVDEKKVQSIWGEPWQLQSLAGCTFQISAQSFFQTNFVQTERLYQIVRENVGVNTPKIVLDAFCGAGTISCMLAKDGHAVTGIESNPFAIENARANAVRNQVQADFMCAPCEEGIARIPKYFDVIVLDPPRAGCFPGALEAIIQKNPKKIVYVSCEPSTLARDVKRLSQAGYRPQFVQPVDMFPFTGHVETVCLLSKL